MFHLLLDLFSSSEQGGSSWGEIAQLLIFSQAFSEAWRCQLANLGPVHMSSSARRHCGHSQHIAWNSSPRGNFGFVWNFQTLAKIVSAPSPKPSSSEWGSLHSTGTRFTYLFDGTFLEVLAENGGLSNYSYCVFLGLLMLDKLSFDECPRPLLNWFQFRVMLLPWWTCSILLRSPYLPEEAFQGCIYALAALSSIPGSTENQKVLNT